MIVTVFKIYFQKREAKVTNYIDIGTVRMRSLDSNF